MNRITPDQKTLQDYLQNKLPADETEQLELWLADHPEVMQDLELELMLKQGITELNTQKNGINSLVSDVSDSAFFNHLGSALILVLGFLLGGLTVHYADFNGKAALVNPDTILLSITRGAETDVSLNSNKATVIQIPVGYLSDDSFSVEIVNQSEQALKIDNLRPKDDLVTLLIPNDSLTADFYQLKLTNLNTNHIETYNLEVR